MPTYFFNVMDGAPVGLGENSIGQLGDGTTTNRNAPAQIQPGTTWRSVSAGGSHTAIISRGSHTAGIRRDGSLWVWGGNTYGQVGNGTAGSSTVPIPVVMP